MVEQLCKTARENDTENFCGERSRPAVGCTHYLRPQSQHLQTIRDEHEARVELGAILCIRCNGSKAGRDGAGEIRRWVSGDYRIPERRPWDARLQFDSRQQMERPAVEAIVSAAVP